MTKLLYFGDPHARGTNPRNRTDDYFEAFRKKMLEIFEIVKQHDVDAILQPGDTFHSPDVANSVLNATADLFSLSPVPIYTTVGNHDIPGYNIEAYKNTSLYLLQRLVPQLRVLIDPSEPVILGLQGNVKLTATPYSRYMDEDGFGYSPEEDAGYNKAFYSVHMAHGMLLDHDPPFEKFTRVQDVETTAHMVLTGHDHTGFGVYKRKDGKIFINPGALMRGEASLSEIKRPIQVVLIEIKQGGSKWDVTTELIPLESAAKGELVLDRSKIEKDKDRQYAMNTFAALMQNTQGQSIQVDINEIVERIASVEGMDEAVLEKALDKIEEARINSKEAF